MIIFVWIIFGAICAYMANNRGRNSVMGFCAGLLFGLFAMLYYAIVGDSVERRIAKRNGEIK